MLRHNASRLWILLKTGISCEKAKHLLSSESVVLHEIDMNDDLILISME